MNITSCKPILDNRYQQQAENIDLLNQTLTQSLWGLHPNEVPKQVAANVIYTFTHMLEPHHPLAQRFYVKTLREYQLINDMHVRLISDELNLKGAINADR